MNFNHENEVFKTIYAALQSKLVHVQYTTTKALILQSKMLAMAKNKKKSVEELTNLINKLYKYQKNLEKRTQRAGTSKSADEKKLISLVNVLNAEIEEIRQSTIISSKFMKSSAESLLMIILKAQHYQWRELVYMSALSQSNHSILQQDEFNCALGKWYNGEGKDNFKHLPAFSLLGDYHSKFHRISADILKEGFNSISWEKISRNLEEFEKYSNLVISALDQLDEQIIMIAQINCDS